MRLSIVFCLSWKPHHTMSLLWCLSTHWLSRRSAMLARNLAILDPTIIVKNQLLRQVEITNMGGMSVYRHFSKIKALNVWDGFTMWNIQDGFTSMSCMTVPYGLSGGKWMWNLLFVGVVKWGGEEVKCLHFGCPCADHWMWMMISMIWCWDGVCALTIFVSSIHFEVLNIDPHNANGGASPWKKWVICDFLLHTMCQSMLI